MGDAERYWLMRASQMFGPYTLDDLLRFEADRRVGASDSVRRDGSEAWRPWSEFRSELGVASIPPRAAPPTSASAVPVEPAGTPERNVALEIFLPVNRNVWAIIAPYVGLFGLFVWIPGPVAIALGIVAWKTTKPGQAGRGRAIVAIVLGAIGTLLGVAFVIALLLR